VALVAASILLSACGQKESKSAISASQREIARLRQQNPEANRLLASSPADFRRRVRDARGPVVVNQWASWCGPCRFEFPMFQKLSERYRGRVTFLGVDAKDNDDDARQFLARYPTPYAHLKDPDAKIARVFRGGRSWPTTAYYDARGRLKYSHQGAYRDEPQLDGDIRRYALGR
jgi:thiol-disulfide isomerase/thioredoxin